MCETNASGGGRRELFPHSPLSKYSTIDAIGIKHKIHASIGYGTQSLCVSLSRPFSFLFQYIYLSRNSVAIPITYIYFSVDVNFIENVISKLYITHKCRRFKDGDNWANESDILQATWYNCWNRIGKDGDGKKNNIRNTPERSPSNRTNGEKVAFILGRNEKFPIKIQTLHRRRKKKVSSWIFRFIFKAKRVPIVIVLFTGYSETLQAFWSSTRTSHTRALSLSCYLFKNLVRMNR